MGLSAEHRESLEKSSAVRPDVIEARGYKTVIRKSEIRALGFSDNQIRVPALLIPVWGVMGSTVLYQARPDSPRIRQGKAVKYETPAGSLMTLDVHPFARKMLADPAIPLWITEGVKKGDALISRGCCAVALLGVWNWRGSNEHGGKTALADWEYIALNGRQVYICFDSDVMLKAEVHAALVRLADFLKRRGAKVALVYLPPGPGGAKQGADDFLASGKTVDDLLPLATIEPRFVAQSSNGGMTESSPADRAVNYVLESGIEFFHDQHGDAFVAFDNAAGWREVWPLKSKAAGEFIRWRFYQEERKGLCGEALATARGILSARARFEGPKRDLAVRVAAAESALWYDLGDWRAVRVTAEGWSVTDRPPILFCHYPHQIAQVEPRLGGNLEPFLDILNLKDHVGRLLVKVYLVAALLPQVPLPILVLHGEQGSAKSTFFRLVRALVDPSSLGTLAFPDSLREFVQLASHHRALYLDNVTHLPDWLSDALCRLCTGEGFSKRELYTDDGDVVYGFRGLGGINGINLAATKPDLLDRSIILKLDSIPDENRRTEEELWAAFHEMRPSILGGMFDLLVAALRRHPEINLRRLPRLADFARWGVAISGALGRDDSDFLKAYGANVVSQNESALEESPVAQAVLGFVEVGGLWEGTATNLLAALEGEAERLNVSTKMKAWPKAPNVLSRRLREVTPNLRRVGVAVSDLGEKNGVRVWRISRQCGKRIATTPTIAAAKAVPCSDNKRETSPPDRSESLSEKPVAEAAGSDRCDSGDISPASTPSLSSPTALGRKRVTL